MESESSYSMLGEDSDFETQFTSFPKEQEQEQEQEQGNTDNLPEFSHNNMVPFFGGSEAPGIPGIAPTKKHMEKIVEEVREPTKIPNIPIPKPIPKPATYLNSWNNNVEKMRPPYQIKMMSVDDYSKLVLDHEYSEQVYLNANSPRTLFESPENLKDTNSQKLVSDFFKELYEKASFDVCFDNLDIYLEASQKEKILPIFSTIDLKDDSFRISGPNYPFPDLGNNNIYGFDLGNLQNR